MAEGDPSIDLAVGVLVSKGGKEELKLIVLFKSFITYPVGHLISVALGQMLEPPTSIGNKSEVLQW